MGRGAAADPKKRKQDQSKRKPTIDPLQAFAEKCRRHRDLESRWALLIGQEARVEYIRGKDFTDFIGKHPDLKKEAVEALVPAGGSRRPGGGLGAGDVNAVEEVVVAMMMRGLLVRCDRVVKKIRPGRTKLSSWPAKLQLHPDHLIFSDTDSFYAWTFEMRTTVTMAALSGGVVVLTLAACLFPVFPRWAKLGVLYLLLTFLGLIFGILLLRASVFALCWVLLGKRIWFLPNIFSEEVNTYRELFRFLPTKDDAPAPGWYYRLLGLVAIMGVVWLLLSHGPDEAQRSAIKGKVTNTLEQWLEWTPQGIEGEVENATVGNPATENLTVENETIRGEAGGEPLEGREAERAVGEEGVGGSAAEAAEVGGRQATTAEGMASSEAGASADEAAASGLGGNLGFGREGGGGVGARGSREAESG